MSHPATKCMNPDCGNWDLSGTSGHCDACYHYQRGFRQGLGNGRAEGIASERARIVAWLFHRAAMRDPARPKESLVASTLYEALAKQIQAGAHEEDHCGNATERGEHEDK